MTHAIHMYTRQHSQGIVDSIMSNARVLLEKFRANRTDAPKFWLLTPEEYFRLRTEYPGDDAEALERLCGLIIVMAPAGPMAVLGSSG